MRAVKRLHRKTVGPRTEYRTDGELLEGYLHQRDTSAFEALVERHGPMVLGVCRRVLRNDADAEDAFQATFLVLVRKADSIWPREMVGNWLYGVAHRTALKARATICKRWHKERAAPPAEAHANEGPYAELLPLLERALRQLPDKYRAPLLLCSLEGKTLHEAAHQLGWPQGTVASRVARGRQLLAKRLTQQGCLLAPILWPAGKATAAVPPALAAQTTQAAQTFFQGTAAASTSTVLLAEKVVSSMNAAKWLVTSVFVPFLGFFVLTLIGLAGRAANGQPLQPSPLGPTLPTATTNDSDDSPEARKARGFWQNLTASNIGAGTNAPRAAGPGSARLPDSQGAGTETVEEQRAVNLAAWKAKYLPVRNELTQKHPGKWLAVVAGHVLPVDKHGTITPAVSLAEADAAARRTDPLAKHRFVFQIGAEGDVTHHIGASGESNRLGRAFLTQGVENARVASSDQVWFLLQGKWHKVGVAGAHAGAPYVAPELSAPLAPKGRQQKMLVATGIDAVAVVTPELAKALELEKWEIPGQATLPDVKHPCPRAYLRFRWQEPQIDVTLPVVIWEGFMPPPEEKPIKPDMLKTFKPWIC
jgi:RNA polymerase sigma factor (sigma-70 family)